MEKKDIFQIVRDNDEKFQKHIQKIKELEEKEKKYKINQIQQDNVMFNEKQNNILKYIEKLKNNHEEKKKKIP